MVLAVGYTYLQAIADEAQIETVEAQVKTAQALYDQASDQVNAGTSPAIDGCEGKGRAANAAAAVDTGEKHSLRY